MQTDGGKTRTWIWTQVWSWGIEFHLNSILKLFLREEMLVEAQSRRKVRLPPHLTRKFWKPETRTDAKVPLKTWTWYVTAGYDFFCDLAEIRGCLLDSNLWVSEGVFTMNTFVFIWITKMEMACSIPNALKSCHCERKLSRCKFCHSSRVLINAFIPELIRSIELLLQETEETSWPHGVKWERTPSRQPNWQDWDYWLHFTAGFFPEMFTLGFGKSPNRQTERN